MKFSLAPMEGITGYNYRRVFHQFFGPMDQYYTPFLSPNQTRSFMKREGREVDPANNQGLKTAPQLLTRVAEDFLWGASRLKELGYEEVNLNLGCPSGTVTGKGKGSGFLADPESLDHFLDDVFSRTPLPVSIKTRIGKNSDDEWEGLLNIFKKYPIAQLIVHPRIQKDFYQNTPRKAAFGEALRQCPFPVCYNGDIFTVRDYRELIGEYSSTQWIMLGRGVLINPGLLRELKGGPKASREELKEFHDCLLEAYVEEFHGDKNYIFRMKELWTYFRYSFEDPERIRRTMRKVKDVSAYERAVEQIFREQELNPDLSIEGNIFKC